MKTKPKVGFFDFTGCEGCQLTVLNLEDQLLDLLNLVEIVEFREVMTGQVDSLDIAFVEGSITREQDVARLKEIRSRAGKLIALGACADMAGINALRVDTGPEGLRREVYASDAPNLKTFSPRRIAEVVPVDGRLPGCPVDGQEFLSVLQALLLDRKPVLPAFPVCVECKLAENACTFERGIVCLGPVVRGGCQAICIAGGDRCRGCRGLVDQPRSSPYRRILEENGLGVDEILAEFRTFNIDGGDES
ncbi:MAG: NADH:ubiquinone oxidoreductase [Desulfuromonadales bacterium]|nr:NADH:ubiquinone oxidoreductase [Desulfuromonadales bacterium]